MKQCLDVTMAMPNRISAFLEQLGSILNELPGVFSTPQWGGRAYKVQPTGGSRPRPKLLAFVSLTDSGDAVQVSFKLSPSRAETVVRRYTWISPHSFRTLAPAGWVTAGLRTARQLTALTKLLAESRTLYGSVEQVPSEPVRPAPPGSGSDSIVRRIDQVMGELRAEGWAPPGDDDFAR